MEQEKGKSNSSSALHATVINTAPVSSAKKPEFKGSKDGAFKSHAGRKSDDSRRGRRSINRERVRPEYDQRILNIRRVARVVSGGRRFSFSVAMVIGNRNGSVGVGLGKGADTALAIDKAMRNAKKNLLKLNLTKTMSIPHILEAKYSSARVFLRGAPGRGLSSGSAMRSVLELAGLRDVAGKILSPSKNKLNIARATILALSKIKKV